jgi:hypothetical protein
MVTTPEEFRLLMEEIAREYAGNSEALHIEMDTLMCQTLRGLGYDAGVDVFARCDKWYS